MLLNHIIEVIFLETRLHNHIFHVLCLCYEPCFWTNSHFLCQSLNFYETCLVAMYLSFLSCKIMF